MHHLFNLSLMLLLIFCQTHCTFLSLKRLPFIHATSLSFYLSLCVFIPLSLLQDSEVRQSINRYSIDPLLSSALHSRYKAETAAWAVVLSASKTPPATAEQILYVSPAIIPALLHPLTHMHTHTHSLSPPLSLVTVAQIIQALATPPHSSSNRLPLLAIFLQHTASLYLTSPLLNPHQPKLAITAVWCRISPLQHFFISHSSSLLLLLLSFSSLFPLVFMSCWCGSAWYRLADIHHD